MDSNSSLLDTYLPNAESASSAPNAGLLDAYLPPQPPQQATPDSSTPQIGMVPSALTGAVQGINDIGDGANLLLLKGANAAGVVPDSAVKSWQQQLEGRQKAFTNSGADNTAGEIGRIAGNVVMTAPLSEGIAAGSMVRGLSGVRAIAGNALVGMAQGGTTNALTQADNGQSVSQNFEDGGKVGMVAGAILPALGVAKNALAGGGVDSATADLARKAADYGIPLRGGQISSSPFVKYADSAIGHTPGSGYPAMNQAQQDAFTKAVGNTFGADSTKLDPATMQAAKARLGAMFDQVAKNTTITNTNQLISDLQGIGDQAQSVLGNDASKVTGQIDNIQSAINNGTMSGETYQALTRKGAPLERAMKSSDPNVSYYAGQIRSALDDALQQNASGADLDTLKVARAQYKALKTVEPLVANNTSDQVSPNALFQQVKRSYGNTAYQTNALSDLADIGKRFLAEPGTSGTPERTMMNNIIQGVSSLGAGAVGYHELGPYGFAASLAPTIGLPVAARVTGAVLNNPLYRSALLRSATATPSTGTNALQTILPSAAVAASAR